MRLVLPIILLTLLTCTICSPLLSQPVGQQLIAVLGSVADQSVPNQYKSTVRDILEGAVSNNMAYRLVDRISTDDAVSEIGYQSGRTLDIGRAKQIGAMLGAHLVCVPELQMDQRGFVTIVISLIDIESGLTTKQIGRPVPRDNPVAINQSIETLVSRALGLEVSRPPAPQARARPTREIRERIPPPAQARPAERPTGERERVPPPPRQRPAEKQEKPSQEALPSWHVGVSISLVPSPSMPDVDIDTYLGSHFNASDISSKTGFVFGLFCEKEYSQFLASRFAFEYGRWGGKTVDYSLLSKTYNGTHFSLSTDLQICLFRRKFIYIFGGIGYHDKSVADNLWGETLRYYDISSGTFHRLGAGGYFTKHCGVEISSTTFDDGSKPWVAISFLMRI